MITSFRVATVADIPYLVEEGEKLHDCSAKITPYIPAAIAVFLRRAILSKTGVAWLYCEDTDPQGGLLATFNDHPFGWGCLATEWGLWVPPDRRGAGVASGLIRLFEEEGRARGAVASQLTCMLTSPLAADLFRRHGYVEQETLFVKVL